MVSLTSRDGPASLGQRQEEEGGLFCSVAHSLKSL